jgi:hypothetical protein
MPQILSLAVLLLCFSTFSLSVSAQSRWKLAAVDSNGQSFYVDENFTQQSNGNILGWQKGSFLINNVYPVGSYYIVRYEWDCRNKTSRQLQIFIYDSFGRSIKNIAPDTSWTDNPPGSIGDVVLNDVCRTFEKKNNLSQRPFSVGSFAEIIKKSNLMSEADLKSKVIRKVAIGDKLVLSSEESTGGWYQVIDPKTNSEGWLNGNHFKIVKAKKLSEKVRRAEENS